MISLEAVLVDHRILTTESEPETLLLSYPEQQLTWEKSCWIEYCIISCDNTTKRRCDDYQRHPENKVTTTTHGQMKANDSRIIIFHKNKTKIWRYL